MHLGQNERNYHIFYQVLAAIEAGDNRLSKYALESVDPTHFKILGNGPFDIQDFNGEPINEAQHFEQTILAMNRSGFSYDEIENVIDVIIAVLYLGNVSINGHDDDRMASIDSNDDITKAAKLLKVEPDALKKCLLKKTVKYPGQVIEVDHSQAEA